MANSNWKNRTIFTGDNLPVLRGLNSESVDLVYLDPPFNSNRNYAAPVGGEQVIASFKDVWTLDDVDEQEHDLLRHSNPVLHDVILAARGSAGDSMMSYLLMMSTRLVELHRVLKPTGSLYLHCDPTASHYLKMVLDTIFSRDNFKNEIVWQRHNHHTDAQRYGAISDRLLFYSGKDATWNTQFVPYKDNTLAMYHHQDERGKYRLHLLTGPWRGSGGESAEPWRGIDPTLKGKCWATPTQGAQARWIRENVIPDWPEAYPGVHNKLDTLDEHRLLHWPAGGGMPSRKQYLDAMPGKAVGDIFTDIAKASSKERVGYPTQKPVKLLERIIQASSNPGDVVLDPFCGCATTAIAAENLGREWVGIDLSEQAVRLVKQRLRDYLQLLHIEPVDRTDLPLRTDLGELPHYRTWHKVLYGECGGDCQGCGVHYLPKDLEVDHIVPVAAGGTDHRDNLQLLCGNCNRRKGKGSMSELMLKLLTERGIQ